MVQDELIRLRVQFEAGALLAFEAAIALDEKQQDAERQTWLRLATALAKYLTAEYAISSARAALELIGGNGYTSDYPVARLLRDAQVLTVWEGPANIQALELLRLLAPKYQGWEQYEARVNHILKPMPDELARLRNALERRLNADRETVVSVMRGEASRRHYARKLLHRLSESLGFALLCHAAAEAPRTGYEAQQYSAWLYLEGIEGVKIGSEDREARSAVLESLRAEASRTQGSARATSLSG